MRSLLALALALSLAACGDSKQGTPPAPGQPGSPVGTAGGAPTPVAALDAVPVDAQLVAEVRIADLAGQPLVERAVDLMFDRDPKLERRLRRLFEVCQIDPARDLSSALVAIGRGPGQVLMVVSGRLAEPDFARCANQGMVELGGSLKTVTGASGHTIYHASGVHEVYFAFLGSGTLAVSAGLEWLEKALGGGDKIARQPVLGPLIAKSPRDAGLWLVGLVPAPIGRALVGAVKSEIEEPPVAFTAHLRLDGGLDAELGLVMAKAEDANMAVSKTIPQLALSALVAQRYSLGAIVNKIRVTADGAVLRMGITLTENEVDETLARLDLIGAPPGTEVDTGTGPLQDTPIRKQ